MMRSARLSLFIALLVLPLLLQGASLPHTHAGGPDGLFNQEHDLTLLATVSTVAAETAPVPVVIPVLIVTSLTALPAPHGRGLVVGAADSRAPPAR
jgi:hypothetical protein